MSAVNAIGVSVRGIRNSLENGLSDCNNAYCVSSSCRTAERTEPFSVPSQTEQQRVNASAYQLADARDTSRHAVQDNKNARPRR